MKKIILMVAIVLVLLVSVFIRKLQEDSYEIDESIQVKDDRPMIEIDENAMNGGGLGNFQGQEMEVEEKKEEKSGNASSNENKTSENNEEENVMQNEFDMSAITPWLRSINFRMLLMTIMTTWPTRVNLKVCY